MITSAHSIHSSLREKMVEHKFIYDFISYLWQKEIYDVEIAKAEVDNAGYDLIICSNKKTCYIQLKSTQKTTPYFPINSRLWDKPNSFVIWIKIQEDNNGLRFVYNYCSLGQIDKGSLQNALNPRTRKVRENTMALPTRNNFHEVTFQVLLQTLFEIEKQESLESVE